MELEFEHVFACVRARCGVGPAGEGLEELLGLWKMGHGVRKASFFCLVGEAVFWGETTVGHRTAGRCAEMRRKVFAVRCNGEAHWEKTLALQGGAMVPPPRGGSKRGGVVAGPH